jgi:ankyrin repeat protein
MANESDGRIPEGLQAPPVLRMSQPQAMKTERYVYGVEELNGFDAWALFEACAQGDLPKAKALLTKDPRLANAQFWYQFPIHMAVCAGHAELVELLLKQGADPGQSRFTYNSWDKLLLCTRERGYRRIESILVRAMRRRFHYRPEFDVLKAAIIERNARKVEAVLRRHRHLASASDALGNNPLHWSVITRQLGLIERFAELGTPLDAERADGQTPVLLAASGATDYWYRATRNGSHPSLRNTAVIVGSLLARGARYTISVAAAIGDQERVEELLRKDASLARRLDSARRSPLGYAAREGHRHIVRLLLEHGADPNIPEDLATRGAALYLASCGNHLEVAELLLEHGADPNAGMDSSECCLTIGMIRHGDQAKPLQELLRRHGAYAPPYHMDVAQMKAAIRGGHEVVRDEEFLGNLIEKRDGKLLDLYLDADPNVPELLSSGCGITYPKSPALVRRLLERGLDPNRPDWLGKTFLHACAENGDQSVASIFLDAGADVNARELEFQGTPLAAAVRSFPTGDDPEKARRGQGMIAFLLKRGAATNLPGDEPWATPLAWARRRGLREIEAMLREHGASCRCPGLQTTSAGRRGRRNCLPLKARSS